jgi:DNA (cytosine-5)-methyltransferase 1
MSARSIGRASNPGEDLIFDLFAGGGGASEGIVMATGRHPDVAVNHDADAVALHKTNHPPTHHLCEDIRKVDIAAVMALFGNRPVGLLWASPDCKHHSKARGGKPKDKNIRGLAWEVCRWAAAIKRCSGVPPRVIALENVEEFSEWSPLHRYGKRANTVQRHRKGETFRLWCAQIKALGNYRLEYRELVAANYGAPTTRKRLVLVAVAECGEIDWPLASYAPRGSKSRQTDLFATEATLPTWRSAAECIDWDRPIPSIFGRKRALQPKTRARIAKGIKRYVIEAPKPFIVKVTHTTSSAMAASSADPLQTITTAKGGEFAVSAPTIMPLTHHGDAGRSYSPLDPMKTVTAAHRGELSVGATTLIPRYGERSGQEPRALSIEEPYPTVVPDGNGGSLAVTHITKFSENSVGTDPADPLHTAMAGAPRHGVVAAYLGRQFGSTVSGRDLADPHPAVMTNGGGGKSQEYYGSGVAARADDPLDTATAKARFGLASAFMEQANTGVVGHDAREPVSTIVGAGSTQRLVEAGIAESGFECSRRDAVLQFLWEHFGAPTSEETANPIATALGRLRFGLVIIGDVCWQIVDIGMRMLIPRELYRAQGFPEDYEIEITWEGRPLTKTAQTRMAGNSVSPPMAAAVLRSVLPPSMLAEASASSQVAA